MENVGKWIADGSLKTKSHVIDGMDNAADGLLGIFKGANFGKAVLKL
jgi:NADPH-dependent curcumin reductase CurA